jgi:putative PIN family toxin of toxin-antitoxin system
MKSNSRYVFDSNVLVSALLFANSTPGQALTSASERGTILLTEDLVTELSDVLKRSKFDRYVSRSTREEFLEALIRDSYFVDVVEHVNACRDVRDDHILEAAVNGNASHIITGDRDLLVLNPFREIRIMTPTDMVQSSLGSGELEQ